MIVENYCIQLKKSETRRKKMRKLIIIYNHKDSVPSVRINKVWGLKGTCITFLIFLNKNYLNPV